MSNPIRTCIACRQKFNKEKLMRVVRIKEEFFIDEKLSLQGRSCYFCKNKQCIEKICKNKLLNKNFKTNINEDIYNKLNLIS